MGEDDRLAALGERVAALEADARHSHAAHDRLSERLDDTRREVVDTAAAAGRQGAISYNEGLRASFIETTQGELKALDKGLRRLGYAVVALVFAVTAMGTVIGVKLGVLVP